MLRITLLQEGIRAGNSSTQQNIQLVVHRIYEQLVAALNDRDTQEQLGHSESYTKWYNRNI